MEETDLSEGAAPDGWTAGPAADAAGESLQVIGLLVGAEQLLVSILTVREIVRFAATEVTRVPHSHAWVLGVVNLRGRVIPVVDLGLRLGVCANVQTRRRMVVVESATHAVGFTVDGVSEVRQLPMSAVELLPVPEDVTIGIATSGGNVTSLLDLKLALPRTDQGPPA